MWNGKKVFEEIMADNFPYLAKKSTHKFKDSRSSANSKQEKKKAKPQRNVCPDAS